MMKTRKKAIVVGAGIGGLAIAIRLSVKGYQVQVFEANPYPGGKLTAFNLNGYRFDAGPSLFTMPAYVEELFQISGENPETFEYIKLNEVCRYFFDDGTRFTASADNEKLKQDLSLLFNVSPQKVDAYFKKSEFIYHKTKHIFLDNSLHKLKSYLNFKTLDSIFNLPFINTHLTLHQLNSKHFSGNKKAILYFNRFATYNGSNPYQAPATLQIIPHLEHGIGAFLPKNGMHQITESVYELAKRKGVEFFFNEKVEEILVRNKKAVGIKTEKGEYPSDVVVSNMDIVPTYRKLLKNLAAPEKTLKQERSSSALIFYWGIKREFPELGLHNIFFTSDYEMEFNAIFKSKLIDKDPTVYINITSKNVKTDAPVGCENWFVMINVPENIGQNWKKLISEARENIIRKLNAMLNTDLHVLIETEEILNPELIEAKTSSFHGSLYGTSSNNKFSAFFRHPNFSNDIQNLYFVGGSVHPGGGIPLALSSAKIAARLIQPA